jgi:putative transposase
MPEQSDRLANRRESYKSDLTDARWELIRSLLPPARAKNGFPPTDLREVINTILYQNRTGCQWDMIPHDLVARSTAFRYYKAWQTDGTWQKILDALRAKVRASTDRPQPPQPPQPQPEAKSDAAAPAERPGPAPAPAAKREETPSFALMDS